MGASLAFLILGGRELLFIEIILFNFHDDDFEVTDCESDENNVKAVGGGGWDSN